MVAIGAAASGYYFYNKQDTGYPGKIVEQANALHEHMLSFDSHVTVPLDLGSAGNEIDKDGPGQFDLVKAGKGRLSGAALTLFGWSEL
ncbi:hypothetical protein D3C79_1047080 [compost metagenome]